VSYLQRCACCIQLSFQNSLPSSQPAYSVQQCPSRSIICESG
jgi:hypothetical protein